MFANVLAAVADSLADPLADGLASANDASPAGFDFLPWPVLGLGTVAICATPECFRRHPAGADSDRTQDSKHQENVDIRMTIK